MATPEKGERMHVDRQRCGDWPSSAHVLVAAAPTWPSRKSSVGSPTEALLQYLITSRTERHARHTKSHSVAISATWLIASEIKSKSTLAVARGSKWRPRSLAKACSPTSAPLKLALAAAARDVSAALPFTEGLAKPESAVCSSTRNCALSASKRSRCWVELNGGGAKSSRSVPAPPAVAESCVRHSCVEPAACCRYCCAWACRWRSYATRSARSSRIDGNGGRWTCGLLVGTHMSGRRVAGERQESGRRAAGEWQESGRRVHVSGEDASGAGDCDWVWIGPGDCDWVWIWPSRRRTAESGHVTGTTGRPMAGGT